jgi:alkanesulfonate monooxygenase SsuD/methylene tetrahydromethanopterin reductase-like flavin-dependent oxidoreductase (luciferase family)
MQLGMQTLQFVNDPTRPLADEVEELVLMAREADRQRVAWLSASQHWLLAPTIWPQPVPLLARLAGEAPHVRLMAQMLLLPLNNPVQIAEDVATLDQLSRGRVTLGIANGYRDAELRAAGIARKDRGGPCRGGIAVLTKLWSGGDTAHEGRLWQVDGRMDFGTYQRPRPPIVIAAQSVAAAQRAARIADGVFLGPQVSLPNLRTLADAYREACAEQDRPVGIIGAGRALFLGRGREGASASGREYAERAVHMYAGWDMKEIGTVEFAREQSDLEWALVGSGADCVAQLRRYGEEVRLTHVTLTPYNLPDGIDRRLEYVRQRGELVVAPLSEPASDTGRSA